jgi:hypothetical protein
MGMPKLPAGEDDEHGPRDSDTRAREVLSALLGIDLYCIKCHRAMFFTCLGDYGNKTWYQCQACGAQHFKLKGE